MIIFTFWHHFCEHKKTPTGFPVGENNSDKII